MHFGYMRVRGLVHGLVSGLVREMVDGLVNGLMSGLVRALVHGLVLWLLRGLVGGLVWGLVRGLCRWSYYNGLIDTMESRLHKGPSATLHSLIVAALGHLKKYRYSNSNEYWIATFLDPSMKAAWFDDDHQEKLHPETP
ncbi:unnamed protein product [Closterium sp. NIES-64]|nr:unnamed protein product [Closterium sp. NIES-64]CAI5994559.1 unnamed protein product [Closterium sp. NIES-64]